MKITVDDRGAQHFLAETKRKLSDLPMREVAANMEEAARDTFRKSVDPWLQPWPPHSPLTLAKRRKRSDASERLLQDSSKMFDSMRSSHDATSAEVTIGEGLPDPRAVVNQFGATNAGRSRNVRIPARPFFPIKGGAADPPETWWKQVLRPIDEVLENIARFRK